MTDTRPFHVLLVGLGYWGQNYFRSLCAQEAMPACAVSSAMCLVATVDPIAKSPWQAGITGRHFHSLTDAPRADAAIVATPAATHVAVVRELLQRGVRHILLEKPAATSTREVHAMAELAAQAGAHIMVGHTYLWHGVLGDMALASLRDIGGLVCMYTKRTNLGPVRHDVPVHWDLATHDLTITQHIMALHGYRFSGRCQATWGNKATRGTVFIALQYTKANELVAHQELVAHIHVSWEEPHKERRVVLVGTQGKLVLDELAAPTEFMLHRHDGTSSDMICPQFTPPLTRQLEAWLTRSTGTDQGVHKGCSLRDAAAITAILEAIDAQLEID